jgi:hypothetical protein
MRVKFAGSLRRRNKEAIHRQMYMGFEVRRHSGKCFTKPKKYENAGSPGGGLVATLWDGPDTVCYLKAYWFHADLFIEPGDTPM